MSEVKVFEPIKNDPDDPIVHTLDTGNLPQNTPVPAASYANAFDPQSDQVSVATGVASATQLESLAAIASTPPTSMVKKDSTIGLVALALALIFIFKGK